MEPFNFDEIYNNAICNLQHFFKKATKYEQIKNHENILKDDLLNAIDIFVENLRTNPCLCPNENDHDNCDIQLCEEVKTRMKNWIEKIFECCDDEKKLEELFKIIAKDAMKFVELEFKPIYIICGLAEVKEAAKDTLKNHLPIEEYLKIVEEFDDLIERMVIVATAVYMEFEDRVFERVGVNKNLKYNIIKLGLKKMGIS